MANPTDPFSASIIPFEVPEQMRALAEKGVSQARDSYARFKDVAETLTERMTIEKQELKARLARLDGLTAIKSTEEIAKRRPYTH